MGTPCYRRLPPGSGLTDARTYVQELDLQHADAGVDRPYTIANFVASVDGHATVDGRSRGLSGADDRDMFYALRERVDAVLVGPRTLAAEHYKRMLPDPERRARRVAAGRPAEPVVVTVSRSGKLPLEIPLFAQPEAQVIVFSAASPVAARLAATVVNAPLAALADALRTLHRNHGVDTLLCEGGPTLLGALIAEHLVDELFLTLAPRLIGGGSGPAVVSGPPPEGTAPLELAGALEHDSTMFLRYRFGRP